MSAAISTLNSLLAKRRDPAAPFSPQNPPTPTMFGLGVPAILSPQPSSGDWSVALDTPGQPGSGLGNIVQGLYDVAQCVRIILSTPKGSDPWRPDFACDAFKYLDKPINQVRTLIVGEATAAIVKWEKRLTLLSITVTLGGALGGVVVAVNWRLALAAPSPAQTTAVTIGSAVAGAF